MFLENTLKNGKEGEGWIEVICGSMFSGKTEELIRRLNRARIANQKVVIFKPAIDLRYDKTDVVSHDRNVIGGTSVANSKDIMDLVDSSDVVGIDEAQFFDSHLPHVCNALANAGVRVIIAGLDMDFKGNPFGPMPHLMAIAEYVTKVHAICIKTGKLAQYSHRITEGNEQVELGEQDKYEPLSRKAYLETVRQEQTKK